MARLTPWREAAEGLRRDLEGIVGPRLRALVRTEDPALNSTEIWEIHNFTVDAHPIHVHQVMFQVVNRQVIGGAVRGPEVWETGFKDTVIAYPGEVTRIKATFDRAGLYVWHCHIIDHEDNEMMRPTSVVPNGNAIPAPNDSIETNAAIAINTPAEVRNVRSFIRRKLPVEITTRSRNVITVLPQISALVHRPRCVRTACVSSGAIVVVPAPSYV